jgi:histone-lysine N-methyltransferase ASH1L
VLRDIWNAVTKAKDENNEVLSTFFMNMPSKRKVPEFYQRITNPIDLGTIEQNIATGVYLTPESFNADMNRLFANYVRFYGRTNEAGVAAIKLKKVYAEAKQQSLPKFENVLGKKPPPNFVKNKGSRSKGVSSTVCSRRGIFFCPFQTRKKTSFGVSVACRATKV